MEGEKITTTTTGFYPNIHHTLEWLGIDYRFFFLNDKIQQIIPVTSNKYGSYLNYFIVMAITSAQMGTSAAVLMTIISRIPIQESIQQPALYRSPDTGESASFDHSGWFV